MKIINNANIPESAGHYSQCIEHNGFLFVSGQLPIDPKTKECHNDFSAQVLLVLQKIEMILNAGGASKDNIIQIRIYISDISYWEMTNKICVEFFGKHKPTRTIVPTGLLHYGSLVEAEAVAYV